MKNKSSLLASLNYGSTVISPDRGRVLTFDREGRIVFYFRHGQTFKRSLASAVHLRFRSPDRQRRQLDAREAFELFEEIRAIVAGLMQTVDDDCRTRIVEEILPWSAIRLAAESERFAVAYRPIAILPPDQYRAVVLQATTGCSWNACTFCNFFMDRPFSMCTVEEFTRHCVRVRDLLGEGLRLRRGIFLADGNALALSNRRLLPLLDIVRDIFGDRELFGFVDLYSGERRSMMDWRHLAERGLRRVYVGMETGLDELLAFVEKPGSARELAAFVEMLKRAGLAVSLIVMVGLGGNRFRAAHRRASLRVLTELPLDQGDLIYLSPFVEHEGSEYARRRLQTGFEPMSPGEVEEDVVAMAAALRQRGLRVGRYDIREFIY